MDFHQVINHGDAGRQGGFSVRYSGQNVAGEISRDVYTNVEHPGIKDSLIVTDLDEKVGLEVSFRGLDGGTFVSIRNSDGEYSTETLYPVEVGPSDLGRDLTEGLTIRQVEVSDRTGPMLVSMCDTTGNLHEVRVGPENPFLEELGGFIRDVYVVEPGSPPILGGKPSEASVILPEELASIPSNRWEVTPEIERFHREHFGARSNEQLRQKEGFELTEVVGPFLAERYGEQKDLKVIELGASTSPAVATTLQKNFSHYFGLDASQPLLERNRDLITEPGFEVSRAYPVLGNTYNMPFTDDVADVVFTSCHPPFVSSSPGDMIQAFAEVHRVLKPGGEFLLFPSYPGEFEPAVNDWVENHFEVVATEARSSRDRQVVIYRKTAES